MRYKESASIYDAIYSATGKNYHVEASALLEFVKQIIGRPVRQLSLLDVACGTGRHLEFFADWFGHVQGTDNSEDMLAIARQRLPNVQFHCTDMRSLDVHDLDREPLFDVVTCLFSAIGHMTTRAFLHRAISQMASHLTPGGILIVEPWLKSADFNPARAFSMDIVDRPDLKVVRIARGERNGLFTDLNMHYTVARRDGIKTFTEKHRLAMWDGEVFFDAFRACGLMPTFEEAGISNNGRGVYIAVKPKD